MKRCVTALFAICSLFLLLAPPARSGTTTIAAVMSSDQPRYREAHRAFVKSLAAHDYKLPSTDISLIAASPDPGTWSAEIRKLAASRPDMLITYGAPLSMVAAKESNGIPVVSVDVFSPESPLKGICGVSSRVSMNTLLKTLHGIRPVRRLGVLYSPREFGSQQQFDEIKRCAAKLGISLVEGIVTSSSTLHTELNRLLEKSDALLVTEGGVLSQQIEHIFSQASARKIPIASTIPDSAEKGALASLEINPQEQGYLAAEIAVRILEGAKAEYLPLVKPQRIDLIVNMRKAREIGIEVPFQITRSATRLIK